MWPEDEDDVPEEPGASGRRSFWAVMVIIVIVALGYAAVVLVGGSALRKAPLGKQITSIGQRIGEVIAPKPPPVALQPFQPPGTQGRLKPTPIILRPSPTQSPVFEAPAPDAPSTVTFTLSYENNTGVQLTQVKVVDKIPSGATYLSGSASPGATFDGSQLVWDLGTLVPGTKGTLTFRVTTRSSKISNTAEIRSKEAPTSSVSSSATVS